MSLILDGTNGLSDVDGTAAAPALRGTDTNTGIFFPAADTIAFAEGGVESARFNSSGNLQTIGTISVGNATPSTSGAGITFPATQAASADANTLDDYEEGTWTPVYSGITGSIGSTAYVIQRGRYTKVGRMVFATAEIELSNKGSWTSGIRFEGLPFTNTGATEVCFGSVILGFVDFAAGELYCNPRSTGANGTSMYIDKTKDNADREILGTAAVANNSVFFINMVYTTA